MIRMNSVCTRTPFRACVSLSLALASSQHARVVVVHGTASKQDKQVDVPCMRGQRKSQAPVNTKRMYGCRTTHRRNKNKPPSESLSSKPNAPSATGRNVISSLLMRHEVEP